MSAALGDFHSHLFPAVDDGARTVEDALEGVGRMAEAGVVRIITTPHFQASVTGRPGELGEVMERMDDAWGRVSVEVAKAFPDMDFRRGLEVMLDIPDPDLSDPRLHLGGTRFILVEWPRFQVPPGTPQVLGRIVERGLVPVVAHPERYTGIDPQLSVVREWKAAGAFLQGNYGSLLGKYGAGPRALMFRFLQEGLLDYLSSDFHGRPEYQLHIEAGRAVLQGAGDNQDDVLGALNPKRLFQDEPPLPVPPLEADRTFFDRLKAWIAG